MGNSNSKLCQQCQDLSKGAEFSQNNFNYIMQNEELNQYSEYQLYIRILQDQLRAAQQQEAKQILSEENSQNIDNNCNAQMDLNIMLSPVALSPQNSSWSVYVLENDKSPHNTRNFKKSINTSKTNNALYNSLSERLQQNKDSKIKVISDPSIQKTDINLTKPDNSFNNITSNKQNSITVTVQQSKRHQTKIYKRPTKDAQVQTKERRKDRVYLYLTKQYSKLKNRLTA